MEGGRVRGEHNRSRAPADVGILSPQSPPLVGANERGGRLKKKGLNEPVICCGYGP